MSTKAKKESVLYIHIQGASYCCDECSAWISSKDRCLFHGITDVIKAKDSCGLWIHGKPMRDGTPKGQVTKLQSGWASNDGKYGCKNCEYFADVLQRCEKVDEKSPGDDPGKITAGACCNAMELGD